MPSPPRVHIINRYEGLALDPLTACGLDGRKVTIVDVDDPKRDTVTCKHCLATLSEILAEINTYDQLMGISSISLRPGLL